MTWKALSVAALGVTFAGCGGLPFVTLNNPVGLTGKEVAVVLAQEATVMGAAMKSANGLTGAMGGGSVETTFADITRPWDADPTAFELDLPVDPTMTVTSESSPETVTLSNITFDLSLSDEAHAPVTLSLPYSGTVTLARQVDGLYEATTTENSAAWSFLGSLPPADVASVMELLTQGGENTASGTIHFTADTLEPGDTITVAFQATTGTVHFD